MDTEPGEHDERAAASSGPAGGLVERRAVLRLGTAAAAGVGAAALIPAMPDRAAAAETDGFAEPRETLATTSMNEAFGGCWVPRRSLERWMCSPRPIRHIACIGDSVTAGKVGGFNYAAGKNGSWPERLATAAGHAIGPDVGFGFRGLWLRGGSQPEWDAIGTWTSSSPSDAFDVCLFGAGLRSNGGASATLTWTRPALVTVAGFDLYWFNLANAGNWQYRVDGGTWLNMNQTLTPADNKLHKFYVGIPVQTSVQVRAYNGSSACLAPIGGIGIYSVDPNTARGLVVDNLGADGQFLAQLVRWSNGDPLAWFNGVVSNPASLLNRPNLVIAMFTNDVIQNNATSWKNNLIKFVQRLRPYADVLILSPFERGDFSTTVQSQYRSATTSAVNDTRCALLDLYDAYATAGATGYAAAQAAGLMYDAAHPSQLGHNDISARAWRVLRTFS